MTYALKTHSESGKNFLLPAIITFLSGVLLTVWPIPHTIAVRQIALALLMIVLLVGLKKSSVSLFKQNPGGIFYAFVGLTLWMTIQSVFIAVDPDAIGNMTSHWLRITISTITGALLGCYIARQKPRNTSGSKAATVIMLAIALPFILHTGIVIVNSFEMFLETGSFGRRLTGLTDGPDKISYLTNIVMALVLAAFAYLLINKKVTRQLGLTALVCIIGAITVLDQYFALMRNGIICAALMCIITITYVGIRSSFSVKAKLGTALLTLVVLAAGVHMQAQDTRWQSFAETLPLGWDTQSNLSWLDASLPMPTLSDGSTVNHSNYVRIAWIKEGGVLIAENPLGRGYERNAFGRALMEKFSVNKVHSLHSHSGIIDFTIATGIPGGILLYGLFLLMFVYGLKSSVKSPSLIIPGLGLALLAADFGTRSLLDSVLRDHMFEMFMFLSCIFVGYIAAVENSFTATEFQT